MLGLNIGFWIAMSVVFVVVTAMIVVFWSIPLKKK